MFPEVCPSCGAVIDSGAVGRTITCRFCGRTIQAIDEESRKAATVDDIRKQMSLGNMSKAYEVAVGITNKDPDDLEAWIYRGNLAPNVADRDLAFSTADRLSSSVPSDCAMVEFVWDSMVYNWKCALEIDGRSFDLGSFQKYREILAKGDHEIGLVCKTKRMTASMTLSVDSFKRVRLVANSGFLSKSLDIVEEK